MERCDACGSLLLRKSYKAATVVLDGRHFTLKLPSQQVQSAAATTSSFPAAVF